jgi:hypothetical protein
MLFLRARLADLIEYAKRIIDVVKRDTVIKTAILGKATDKKIPQCPLCPLWLKKVLRDVTTDLRVFE